MLHLQGYQHQQISGKCIGLNTFLFVTVNSSLRLHACDQLVNELVSPLWKIELGIASMPAGPQTSYEPLCRRCLPVTTASTSFETSAPKWAHERSQAKQLWRELLPKAATVWPCVVNRFHRLKPGWGKGIPLDAEAATLSQDATSSVQLDPCGRPSSAQKKYMPHPWHMAQVRVTEVPEAISSIRSAWTLSDYNTFKQITLQPLCFIQGSFDCFVDWGFRASPVGKSR